MENSNRYRFKTISEYHKLAGLPKPTHPLISVVNMEDVRMPVDANAKTIIFDFYSIALKRVPEAKIKYGQQMSDFDDGVLFFMAPGQVFTVEVNVGKRHRPTGWIILFHSELMWHTHLAKVIKGYDFFDYALFEALHISENEEIILNAIAQLIKNETNSNIDHYTQNVIISQLELLLNYAQRFYGRQFITRKAINHEILDRLETIVNHYFEDDNINGLPTVAYIAEKLNISAGYLSGLLKTLIGQNTQQYLHQKLIDLAKEKLSTTSLSISEIAYTLGFEHIQSFTKLFKAKTNLTPSAFRQSFN